MSAIVVMTSAVAGFVALRTRRDLATDAEASASGKLIPDSAAPGGHPAMVNDAVRRALPQFVGSGEGRPAETTRPVALDEPLSYGEYLVAIRTAPQPDEPKERTQARAKFLDEYRAFLRAEGLDAAAENRLRAAMADFQIDIEIARRQSSTPWTRLKMLKELDAQAREKFVRRLSSILTEEQARMLLSERHYAFLAFPSAYGMEPFEFSRPN